MKGLYIITDERLCATNLVDRVMAAIRGGAKLVQYRNKQATAAEQLTEASQLLDICRAFGVPLLINDDPQLAKNIGADGVHIGQSDTRLAEARALLGPGAIIGVTCHDSLQLAEKAQNAGASYVAFGRFFVSNTKPEASPADIDILRQAKDQLAIPVCAIGGITPENATSLLEAGADMLAVIHGVFGQKDIETAAKNYSKLFN